MRVTYFILIFASEKTKTIIINLQNKTIMKKIFTLIAIAMMAVGAQAQTISFTEAISAKDADGNSNMNGRTFGSDGFILTCTDTSVNDDNTPNPKLSVDGNTARFGTTESYDTYTFRLKTGGKSSSKNCLSLAIPSAGTLKIAVRSGKNTDTDRNLVLKQGGTELFNQVIKENEETDYVTVTEGEGDEAKTQKVYPYVSVEVTAGTVDITYPKNSLNFYAFILETSSTTGIESVKAVENENAPMYNLAGQQVDKNFKGVVIQNGKKFINK